MWQVISLLRQQDGSRCLTGKGREDALTTLGLRGSGHSGRGPRPSRQRGTLASMPSNGHRHTPSVRAASGPSSSSDSRMPSQGTPGAASYSDGISMAGPFSPAMSLGEKLKKAPGGCSHLQRRKWCYLSRRPSAKAPGAGPDTTWPKLASRACETFSSKRRTALARYKPEQQSSQQVGN